MPIRTPHYTLALLSLLAIIGYIDRQVLTVLMEPIKDDLGLNDTMLGALSGTAFAIFYCTAAFPIARWGDHGDRKTIISLCVLVWSVATAACGVAVNFVHLALARIGVAIGEAGANPVSQSLLSDLYPAHRRASVFAVLNAANATGIGLGLAIGGWLATIYPWRTVFLIVSVPGLALAALTWFTAREPRREPGHPPLRASDAPGIWQSIVTVVRIPGLPWMLGTAAATSVTGFGLLTWAPSFLIRVHGLNVQQAGLWMGMATIGGLVAGSVLAGFLSDWAGKRDQRWYAWISAAGLLLAFPSTVAFVLWPTSFGALGFFFLLKFTMTLYMPAMYALALTLAPATSRAMTSAMLGMAINLAGVGIGPLIIGGISDTLQPVYGEHSIRYSLLVVSVGLLFGTVFALLAGRSLGRRQRADAIGLGQPVPAE